MKRLSKKNGKVTKGMPAAVLLSIAIHAALFLLAGMFVVFTVVKKKEMEFVPPKAVERPKMKLKKPKVRMRKNSKPKPVSRITSTPKKASMPDIQLPEMSGMATGLDSGIGGFDMMPAMDEVSLFGGGQTIGNDFAGRFYDLKRDYLGRPLASASPESYLQVVKQFLLHGWRMSDLSKFHRSPKTLFTTHFMIPVVPSVRGPEVFGEDTGGYLWMVHYKGQLVHKEGITFRFRGGGDDLLLVRVGGKLVLNGCPNIEPDYIAGTVAPHWKTTAPSDFDTYILGSVHSVAGDWITLEPGKPLDMEVLIGELRGDFFCAMLLVEVKGEKYEGIGRLGAPNLPMFTTTDLTRDLVEAIHADLVPGEAGVTNNPPIFRDYDVPVAKAELSTNMVVQAELEQPKPSAPDDGLRTWASASGKKFEARYVTRMGDKVVLKDSRGKQRKIPLSKLNEEDLLYVELANPPKFNIDFTKLSKQIILDQSPYSVDVAGDWLPRRYEYVFGAKLKQMSANEYNHNLHVEFFAIGAEIDGDNYILLDRQESDFMPTKENKRFYEFYGDPIYMNVRDWSVISMYRGQKYGGYLVVVTDERGKIIDTASSSKWLPEILSQLRALPIGKHFDKTGTRVAPPRPIHWY